MSSEFGKHPLKPYAFAFAGLAMMLNIRLVYSAAPYALLRFKLPENLFSVFVRVMASSLELWCLPSMTIANVMDFARKRLVGEDNWYDWHYHWQSIFWSWSNFLTFVILWISFIIGGDQGNVTAFYWVIAASGFVFGINMVMVYAMEFQYLPWYMVGENSFPMVTSLMHYFGTLLFGNRRKWNSDYIIVCIDIVISLAISLVAAILWTLAYWEGKEAKDGFPPKDPNQKDCVTFSLQTTPDTGTNVTALKYSLETKFAEHDKATTPGKCGHKKSVAYYLYLVPPSLMVLIGMGLVYTIYPGIAPGMIVPFYLVDKIEMILLIATAVPPVIIKLVPVFDERFNPYVFMGNWGVYHHKVCKGSGTPGPKGCEGTPEKITSVKLELTPVSGQVTHKIILSRSSGGDGTLTVNRQAITLASSGNNGTITINLPGGTIKLSDLTISSTTLTIKKTKSKVSVTKGDENVMLNSTATLTGTGNSGTLSINKQDGGTKTATITGGSDVVLNYSSSSSSITIYGSAIDALDVPFIGTDELHDSHKDQKCCMFTKQYEWSNNPYSVWWNIFNILMPLQICLAAIFIYSLHYRDSAIARSIINQPKMSTALSIIFYMCHEILLALGFPGIATDPNILLPMQLVGAFLMVLLAFYSIGYITEYKRNDPSEWPTDGMTKWNSVCYWLKMASKITNKNFKQLFTTD
uniref:Tpr-related protein family member, putative n=1 Tax=Theileria annulata TaxID=5874 RepID=A0A3B0MVI4_THEAN